LRAPTIADNSTNAAGPAIMRAGSGRSMPSKSLIRSLVAALALTPVVVFAQQPSAPPPSGVYAWFDGAYRNIELPAFTLGAHTIDPATFADRGPVQTFNPRIDAAAFQGGFGFVIPNWFLPASFGSDVRVNLTGKYVRGDATQTAAAIGAAPVLMWLDGTLFFGCGCGFSSELVTNYTSYQLGLDAATDIRAGGVIFTPSIGIVGGRTQTRQTLSQFDESDTYSSNTNLRWHDVGVKFGLGARAPVAPMTEIGLNGTLAVVRRHVRLQGNDFVGGPSAINLGTSIETTAQTWAAIPGGEIELVFKPWSQVQVRLFGGLEWDSKVPGIIGPSFTPAQFFTFQGNPATIGFSGQASYYAGGGFVYAFGR
jgi:hypothetical protein